MFDRNGDIGKIRDYHIRLYAPEKEMEAAVIEVTGERWDMWSELDWSPMDEDDEKPDNCDRFISMYPNRMDNDWPKFWQVAAALGNCGRLNVIISAEGAWISVDTNPNGERRVELHPEAISAALNDRIRAAVCLLEGRPAPRLRDDT